MKRGKILACSLMFGLTAAMVWCGIVASWQHRLAEGMVRLRVVAASDGEADQTVKLLVRDAVLAKAETILLGTENAEDAAQILAGEKDTIREAAQRALRNAGSTDEATVRLTWERTKSREYGSFSLPAGGYVTLRVDLGAAQGQNWWCVVFPPVCTAGAEEAVLPASLTDSDRKMLEQSEGKYVLRFRTLEILESVEEWLQGLKK